MYLILTLYFEELTAIVSGLLGFSVSPDLYNSCETLLICFSRPGEYVALGFIPNLILLKTAVL